MRKNEHSISRRRCLEMARKTKTGTNVQKVRQQNAASLAGNSDVEFASETDVQAVRQQNQQSQQNKKF